MNRLRVLLAIAVCLVAAAGASAQASAPGYYVILLRPNPGRKAISKEEIGRIQAAHMQNIRDLAKKGIIVSAGPMAEPKPTIAGIFVFKSPSLAVARQEAGSDPAVIAGRFLVDVLPWSGPPGMGDGYFKWKAANPDADDKMASHAFCLLLKVPGKAGDRDAQGEAFLDGLRSEGRLGAAGPVDGHPQVADIVIFKGDSLDAATEVLARDPAVAAGRLRPELHLWWCADGTLPW